MSVWERDSHWIPFSSECSAFVFPSLENPRNSFLQPPALSLSLRCTPHLTGALGITLASLACRCACSQWASGPKLPRLNVSRTIQTQAEVGGQQGVLSRREALIILHGGQSRQSKYCPEFPIRAEMRQNSLLVMA